MKIDVICNDGSPLGVTLDSVWGRDGRFGVGGAELALLTLCEGWHRRGYDVTLYNDPSRADVGPFPQKALATFDPRQARDHLIVFRSPNERAYEASGQRIWWSCDQSTVGDFKAFAGRVDKIVTISPFHAEHFKAAYGIENTITIDLPVRDDYDRDAARVPKRCIYTSVPDRGAVPLHAAWPLIHGVDPDASLVLTSDWRLWNPDIDKAFLTPYLRAYAGHANVAYLGAVRRDALIDYQSSADLLLYPCTFDELFCITVAEAQVAGAIPITSRAGALATTNEFGIQIEGAATDPEFIEEFARRAVELLNAPYLPEWRAEMKGKARRRFALDRILDQWDERVFAQRSP